MTNEVKVRYNDDTIMYAYEDCVEMYQMGEQVLFNTDQENNLYDVIDNIIADLQELKHQAKEAGL